MSTAVAIVRVHTNKYEKDFDAVVTFLTQYIKKRAPTLSVKVAPVNQTKPAMRQKTSATHGSFKNIVLKKHYREEYSSMSMAECQQLYELCKKAGLMKGL